MITSKDIDQWMRCVKDDITVNKEQVSVSSRSGRQEIISMMRGWLIKHSTEYTDKEAAALLDVNVKTLRYHANQLGVRFSNSRNTRICQKAKTTPPLHEQLG